jgi:hypothetical protein
MSEREYTPDIPKSKKKESPSIEKKRDLTEGYGEQVSKELFAAQHVLFAKGSKSVGKKKSIKAKSGVVFELGSDE